MCRSLLCLSITLLNANNLCAQNYEVIYEITQPYAGKKFRKRYDRLVFNDTISFSHSAIKRKALEQSVDSFFTMLSLQNGITMAKKV
jgi:hypothetical protein